MLINENCIKCQIKKNLNAYPAGTSQDLVEIYQSRVRDILDRCYGLSTPQFTGIMTKETLYREI